jgi:HD-GYP domain-containing protein (c-di-GMP phosphodiesterase class II)
MSETGELLGKIAALRQRLDQAQDLATEAGKAAATLLDERAGTLERLQQNVVAGSEHDARLDHALRVVTGPLSVAGPLPRQLTSRARRVLERGRDLLYRLRPLADCFALDPDAEPQEGPAMQLERGHPLARLYRDTAALIDTTLRLVPFLPESTTAQLHLCEGLEAGLDVVATRLRTLQGSIDRHRRETNRVHRLADLLMELADGRVAGAQAFLELTEELLAEAGEGEPMRFLVGDARFSAHFVACHSLTVARVAARVVRHDSEWRHQAADVVLAALIHDVGMLQVPPSILAHPDALTDDQRRTIEGHCRAGAEVVARWMPDTPWLAEAAAGHHERLDGTGYPDGLREHQLRPLTRLLAVCDVYAAFCADRSHRPARATRTALADTLLLAEQGLLDRFHAERLLQLSFYPVGMAVEMADGSVGVVVATPDPRRDLNAPARPVVVLLLDPRGEALPLPRYLDLAQCDNHSIVRTLTAGERRAVLGERFPEWVY